MKDVLNLRALRLSSKRKERAIYEKACRIQGRKKDTEELTEEQILNIAKDYPCLKVKVSFGGNILVRSQMNSWLIRVEQDFITLYHKTLAISRGKTVEKYHVQDVFGDVEYALASILSHDDYVLGISARNNSDIRDMVFQNSAVRNQVV